MTMTANRAVGRQPPRTRRRPPREGPKAPTTVSVLLSNRVSQGRPCGWPAYSALARGPIHEAKSSLDDAAETPPTPIHAAIRVPRARGVGGDHGGARQPLLRAGLARQPGHRSRTLRI